MQNAAVAAIQPVESLIVPSELDGSHGTNRGVREHAQVAADNDLDAIRAWLANYANRTTFDNYRKEAERLLLWSVIELGKPLSSLTHEDLIRFQAFLQDPQPASRWVSSNGGKYPRNDERWRPFNGPLQPDSQRQAKIILNGMFNWLVHAGYLRGNPMALLKQRKKGSAKRITRYLSSSLWDEVKSFVEQLPRETDAQKAYYARCRWLTTLFYLQGMRISEVAGGQMKQFFRRQGPDGQDRWWLEIVGKGEKERIVPVSSELIVELRQYRTSNGLRALPSRSEETPLVIPFRGSTRCLHRSAVHDAIKGVFEGASKWIAAKGPEYTDRAEELEQASAHWLRHTAGSHMADGGVDIRIVRDNLGHASLNTTTLYLHTDDDERHSETVKRHRMSWDQSKSSGGVEDDETGT
ncbi:tyrosine-type recombinase/integrase [Paraburkholderia sp. SIMBA_054]|uniref:tyrosine-type recombinase/integrase n=1 Tax=Paraburkholderia sp. SIMBA_054 TaxID=3085795 RepID=UPI0039791FD4